MSYNHALITDCGKTRIFCQDFVQHIDRDIHNIPPYKFLYFFFFFFERELEHHFFRKSDESITNHSKMAVGWSLILLSSAENPFPQIRRFSSFPQKSSDLIGREHPQQRLCHICPFNGISCLVYVYR
jgi:hypothetical protein